MGSALQFYEDLRSAPDDPTRYRLIADAFDSLDRRAPAPEEIARR